MRLRWVPVAVLLLAASGQVVAAEEEALLLRLRLTEGDAYGMTLDVRQDMTMNFAGTEQAMRNEQTMTAIQRITETRDDGVAVTEQTIERMQLESLMGGTPIMSFDSAAEVPAPALEGQALEGQAPEELAPEPGANGLEAMRAMIGVPIVVTTSERAQVLAVEGLDEIWDAIALGDPAGQAIIEQMKSMFGEEAMRQQMQMYGVLFPEEAMAPGHTWSYQIDLSNPFLGDMVFDINYAFAGREVRDSIDCAVLDTVIEADIDFDMSGILGMVGAGGELDMDMAVDVAKMSGEGQVCVDVETGLSRRTDLNVVMELEMAMTMGEETMDMAMSMDQDISMRLDPVAASAAVASPVQ